MRDLRVRDSNVHVLEGNTGVSLWDLDIRSSFLDTNTQRTSKTKPTHRKDRSDFTVSRKTWLQSTQPRERKNNPPHGRRYVQVAQLAKASYKARILKIQNKI